MISTKDEQDRWLNFITFNGIAPIPNLHRVSDAGAGEGLMKLHPTRDTELIACGRANTLLDGVAHPTPVVETGTVTPAILVHGLLMALRRRGFRVRLHCYQLGLNAIPDFSGNQLDELVVHRCELGGEAELVRTVLVPELQRQARLGEEHLIAESGIGGTTLATLWLRRWVDSTLSLAGSTQDPAKLAIKAALIYQLMAQSAGLPLEVSALTRSLELSDPIQRACCTLLEAPLEQLNFAGGAMIFAPVIAMKGQTKCKHLHIATTRWVMASKAAEQVAKQLPQNCHLQTPRVRLDSSRLQAVRLYEQGFVTEGCGLGATLAFAEQQGISEAEIIESLDSAVEPWIANQ